MNELQLFDYEGRQVRTIIKDGQTWFVAKDVCEVLGLANMATSIQRIPQAAKDIHTMDTLGGCQNVSIINEAGLYKLAFTSRKEEAEKFTDWVATEVIPSIRKTGSYSVKKPENTMDLIKRGYDALLSLCESQTKQIEEMKPVVAIHQAVSASPKTFTLEAVGKILSKRFPHIGPRNIFFWLRGRDILMSGSRRNQPKQEHIDCGRFEVIRHSWKNEKTGEDIPYVQTVVTQKGFDWITGLLIKEEEENGKLQRVG